MPKLCTWDDRDKVTFIQRTLLGLVILAPSVTCASQWTGSCDKHGLTQTSTVCLVESLGASYWDKQTVAQQTEMAERARRWGYRKAAAYCSKSRGYGSVPGPASYKQDIVERKKGEVYVGVRMNPDCTEPKKAEKAGDFPSSTGRVARKLYGQQQKKFKELETDCKRDPKSRACDELKALQDDKHMVAVGGNRG